MLATVSSDSSSVSSPPTSPDNVTVPASYAPDNYHRKVTRFEQKTAQSAKDVSAAKDNAEPDHYKADKKVKDKDIKFYQKILSSTGLDRLSKSASATGVPKTTVYKEKSKHGHDDTTLSPVSVYTEINNRFGVCKGCGQ